MRTYALRRHSAGAKELLVLEGHSNIKLQKWKNATTGYRSFIDSDPASEDRVKRGERTGQHARGLRRDSRTCSSVSGCSPSAGDEPGGAWLGPRSGALASTAASVPSPGFAGQRSASYPPWPPCP